jgi:DNA replication protein DnaC
VATDTGRVAVRWLPKANLAARHGDVDLAISGTTADVAAIVKQFKALPTRRLVLIGRPGSGKSTLATLIVLAILNDPIHHRVTVPSASETSAAR